MNTAKLVLIVASLLCHSAFAEEVCKAKTSIGTIVGHGSTELSAKEDASNRCFQRHIAAYESQRGAIDDDKGMDVIDHCANIECQN